jgi:hypothetical protein
MPGFLILFIILLPNILLTLAIDMSIIEMLRGRPLASKSLAAPIANIRVVGLRVKMLFQGDCTAKAPAALGTSRIHG